MSRGRGFGFSEQAGGPLLDGGDGLWGEDLVFHSSDGEVMGEVELHLLEVDTFEMAAGDDTGGEREGGAVLEEIYEVVLAGEDHGQIGFGVGLELAEGVELGEDLVGEGKRRTKVIPRFTSESSGLSLVFAVLLDTSANWRGVRMKPYIEERLNQMRLEP